MAVHQTVHSRAQVLPFRESLLAMIGISFVTMLVALDQTVVGTALPTIVAELKGFELYAWVATSYLLTSVITVPIFGRLGDYYGRKPFVIVSIALFTGASALCGAAHSMLFLVLARGLQGVAGGMLVGTAFACIADLFPDSVVRLRWQVMMSSAFGIANAIGPSLGGFLTQYWGWRWAFYVNLPVGLLSLFFVWRYLPHIRHMKHEGRVRLDWPGALLIAIALSSLQLFVEALAHEGFSPAVAALAVTGVASAAALLAWERRCDHPLLPLDMFRNRSLAALFTLSVLAGFAMFSLLFYAPLLLQGGFGLSPRDAGLVITPLVVFITIGSITNGRIVTRVRHPNTMLYVGFVLVALACFGTVLAKRTMPHPLLMTFMMMGGLGLGFVLPNLTVFAQQTAGREHLGIATALLQSLRMIGGMVGTAITGTLVTRLYAHGVRDALEMAGGTHWFEPMRDPQILVNLDAQRELVAQLARAGLDGPALIELAREALVGAIHAGIAVAMVIALVSLWQCKRVPHVRIARAVEPAPVAE
ncbi:MDR family MFS transporter [Trinickia caryophylli]|uniref:Drug resistance transporter, EmrB/QacA subfamily n=1 Tax=Trinickia caryophylli TaxID=28094 RepID=A0A1X7ESC3_TRICW|nr:MDR family MFS transporter [Trinickia caryophylli]PMS12098.1 MFS transporter [Trinickia caryophylli]TRX18596.1 MFS transporter [Trinickia caryophylli]WQE10609.1 MDR family MFS transporter [Trinickia caryophylli]SMF39289.1 drug resistance transporter, EmrB/QacA subfamily [Trinickia caryophylli]GLU32975.1 MFS transporter [Trinickia caryophylli]